MIRSHFLLAVLFSYPLPLFSQDVESVVQIPKSMDDRVTISLFSREPDVVTPTGIAVDSRGRVFCIESHTHFRPKNYQGPQGDRIRIYEDSNGDGKADKVTTFYEGSSATMNMAFAPDGSLYVATRAKIFRLADPNRDNRPEVNELIIDLQTEGNYPHNGLSGLAFQDGQLYFGFGENLGVDYKLVGSDRTTLSGGGEGGNIYSCRLDGSGLKRMATGFWNPFGMAFDKVGNLIAIDNDPDWRPPCRLLHIVEGGDYGYRFTHGRRGTHPFTAWFGELPGTLGLISGTGEAPSGIVRFDGLSPDANTSTMLSTSWGLHSIERFDLQEKGASFTSAPQTLIKGGKDFRPVAIAVTPDQKTMYVSDWCKRSYELHGHGRIWKVEFKGDALAHSPASDLPEEYPYASVNRQARKLAANRLPAQKIDFPKAIQGAVTPLEKATLIRRSAGQIDPILLLAFFAEEDPFIRQAASFAFEKSIRPTVLAKMELPQDARQRLGLALVMRKFSHDPQIRGRLRELLADKDPGVRFVALRWIGEEKQVAFAEQLESELKTRSMTGRLFESYLAALDMLNENRRGAEFEKAEANILGKILSDPRSKADTLIVALRKLQSVSLRDSFNNNHPKLKLELIRNLLGHENRMVVREAIQTIRDMDSEPARTLLSEIVADRNKYGDVALDAVIGLDPGLPEQRAQLLTLLSRPDTFFRAAHQTFAGQTLNANERASLKEKGITARSILRDKRVRVADGSLQVKRIKDKLASADAERGRLIFYNTRLSQCSKCHQVDGRGGNIGPDLSNTATMSVDRLIESILLPSKEIAPRHTPWLIQTYDGLTVTGVLVAERGEVQTFADANGKLHRVKFDDVEKKKSVAKSIMPEGLLDLMTDQEVADLIKFLKN